MMRLRSVVWTLALTVAVTGTLFAQGRDVPNGEVVPELDPASAVGALALLVGGSLLLFDLLRRRSAARV